MILKLKKKKKESQTLESSKSEIGWGHQIDLMFFIHIEWLKIIELILKAQIQIKY